MLTKKYGEIINFDQSVAHKKGKRLKKNDNLIAKEVGLRIKIVRLMTGLSLKEFGLLCKTEQGMYGRYERGETLMSLSSIMKISIALYETYRMIIDPYWLLAGEGQAPFFMSNKGSQNESLEDFIDFYKKLLSENEKKFMTLENSNVIGTADEGNTLITVDEIDVKEEAQLKEVYNKYCYCKLENKQEVMGCFTYNPVHDIFSVQCTTFASKKDQKDKNLLLFDSYARKDISKIYEVKSILNLTN